MRPETDDTPKAHDSMQDNDQGEQVTVTETPPTETVEVESKAAPLEVVQPPAPAPVDHTGGALDRAAQAALERHDMPGRDEFLTLAATARILAMSGAAPKLVKGNPYIAFHLALVGRDLGISPSAALALIDVIDTGQGPQLSLSPQLLNGQIRRLGAGEILKKRATPTECVAVAVGPGGIDHRCRLTWRNDVHADGCACDILGEVEFTWQDAQMAELAGQECQPGNHSDKCRNKESANRFRCSSGYIKYPKRMMWWRASGFAADDYFPEASLGMYEPEALGAVVDENGRAIDPATAELPDGYETKAIGSGGGNAAEDAADPADLWQLQLRLLALPDEELADVRAKWQQMGKLKGWKPYALSASQYTLATSLVAGAEKKAKSRVGYKQAEATAAVENQVREHIVALLSPPWAGEALSASGAEPGTDHPTDAAEAPEQAEVAAESEPEPDAVEETERVQAMKPTAVKEALFQRGIDSAGTIDQLRKRLIVAMLKERLAAKHDDTPQA